MYRVRFAADELMQGRDWLLCDQHGNGTTLYIRRGAREFPDELMEAVLEDAWEGFRKLRKVPEQRQASSSASASL